MTSYVIISPFPISFPLPHSAVNSSSLSHRFTLSLKQPSGSDPTRVKYRQQSVPDHTLSSDCQSSKEQKAAQNTPVGLQEGPNQPPRGSNLPHGKQEQIFPNNCPQLPLAMLQQQNVFQVDLFLPGDGPHENPFNQYELQAQREVQQMRSIQGNNIEYGIELTPTGSVFLALF